MLETIGDWAYTLERTYPNLHGAGEFMLGGLAVALLCMTGYAVTRKKTHLLALLAVVLYMLPFMM
jgi:hypothetical protein